VDNSILAKEMKLHYASIGMVTDYDCWKENEEVSVEKVIKQMKENANSVASVLMDVIPRIVDADWSKESEELAKLVDGSIF